MVRRIVVRKIVKLSQIAKVFRVLFIIAFTYGLLGIALYLTAFPSSLILIDSVLWIIDSLTYLTLFAILRAVYTRAIRRYEMLRMEDVISLTLSIMTLAVTLYLMQSSIMVNEITPLPLALYLMVSGILSYVISIYIRRSNGSSVKNVVANTVAKRTLLDTLIEFVGALSIIASNVTNMAVFEGITFLGLSAYAIRYSVGMAKEAILNILGANVPVHVRRRIVKVLKNYYGIHVRRILLRRLGSFIEGELWIELPDAVPLVKAQSVVLRLAKDVVSNVPEIIRILIITLPSKDVIDVKTPSVAVVIPKTKDNESHLTKV